MTLLCFTDRVSPRKRSCPRDGGVLGSDEGSGSDAVAFFSNSHQEREF